MPSSKKKKRKRTIVKEILIFLVLVFGLGLLLALLIECVAGGQTGGPFV